MRIRRLRHLAVAAAVFLANASAGHAQQDFYEPPSPLPPGKPGALIRWEPSAAQSSGGNDLPGNAWRILYRSTSATGEPTVVSGMVLVPDVPVDGPRPLIGYSVGTRGLADRCAPSRNIPDGGEPEANTIRDLLDHGWAVSVTDWEGLGMPGDHTYVVGRAEGQAVLDGIRAARELEDAALPADGPLALMGYSQGGHSTAWAAQAQPRYAPELRLSGAAAGAVPSDLLRAAQNIDGGVAAGLVLYAAIGMDTAYPELELERYLNDAGRQAVEDIRDTCVLDGSVFKFGFRESRSYTTTDVPALPDWNARLVENGVGAIAPDAPMFLYHARRDELIPYELERGAASALVREGRERDAHRDARGRPQPHGNLAGEPLRDRLARRALRERPAAAAGGLPVRKGAAPLRLPGRPAPPRHPACLARSRAHARRHSARPHLRRASQTRARLGSQRTARPARPCPHPHRAAPPPRTRTALRARRYRESAGRIAATPTGAGSSQTHWTSCRTTPHGSVT